MLRLHLFSFCILVVLTPNQGAQNCDELGVLLYEDLGCTPVYDGNECPIKFECTLEPEDGKCLFRNQSYDVEQLIPDDQTEIKCRPGCFCTEDGTFVCAIADCYESFYPPDPGNYFGYDLSNCCGYGQLAIPCSATCVVQTEQYYPDQRFVAEETCDLCLCTDGYNNGNPECVRINCAIQLDNYYEIKNKCAPFYWETKKCCPTSWICPNGQVIKKLHKSCGKQSDLKCQFGNITVDYGYGFETFYGQTQVTCECKLPPLLTCTPEIV